MQGKIISINIKPLDASGVGIPKKPVEKIRVTQDGVGDDHNYYRQKAKGNTKQRAVLLLSKEILEDLNEEGWPVSIGDLGENITTENFPIENLREGTFLKVGEIQLQITEKCNPCRTLANLKFVGDEKADRFIETLKGRRGWYAKVIVEGEVKIGDSITVVE